MAEVPLSVPGVARSRVADEQGSGPLTPLHQPLLHESGLKHTSGEARYVDDLPAATGMLVAQVIASPHAHARITFRDASKARAMPGVFAILFAEDVPGVNDVGPVIHDE